MPKILKSVIWMLYRKIEAFIENHLRSDSDNILIIDGARQIGKTFIINHVGKKLFENYIELNFVDDYDALSLLPIEVKSGKDYQIHSALNSLVSNEEYSIRKAIVFSNTREISAKGKICYLPVYYVMFLEPNNSETMI